MLFTTLFAIALLKEKITFQQIVGITIMMLGIYITANHGLFNSFEIQKGDMFIILGCIFGGFGNVLYKKYIGHIALELVLITRTFLATIIFGILLFFISSEPVFLQDFTIQHGISFFLYCVFYIILARYCGLKSFQKAPMSVWSCIMLTGPVLGIFFNYLFLGNIPEMPHYIGGIFIILGFASIHLHFYKTKTHHHIKMQRHHHV